VRELCETHGASLATVTHALHRLEDAGWIEARPRQGFFASPASADPPGPTTSTPPRLPEALDARRERLMALAAARDEYLSLGHLALPDELLPQAAFRRLFHRHLRAPAITAATVAGSARLKQRLADRLNRRGCEVAASEVVVTQGEGESLRLCLEVLTQAGDRVAVTRPVPLRLLELLHSRRLQVVELSADGALSDGGVDSQRVDRSPSGVHDAQRLVRALAEQIAADPPVLCIVDMTSSALAGVSWDDDSARALVSLCTRHDLPLIECDLFGELPLRPDAPRPLKAFDPADRVLHCGSTACITGVGLAVGWVASGRHRLQLTAARAVHGELLPGLTDAVMADFLAGPDADRHLRRLRRQLLRRMQDWTAAVLAAFPSGTVVQAAPAGHQLWVTLPQGLNAVGLLTAARQHGVSFVPGAVFTAGTALDACLRLTTAHALDETRRAAVQLLGRLASQGLA
jgi:DNA-binding transcriptional MocR family regulator